MNRSSPAPVVQGDPAHHRGTGVIPPPAVEARGDGDGLPLGHELQVRLTKAEPDEGKVAFEVA